MIGCWFSGENPVMEDILAVKKNEDSRMAVFSRYLCYAMQTLSNCMICAHVHDELSSVVFRHFRLSMYKCSIFPC